MLLYHYYRTQNCDILGATAWLKRIIVLMATPHSYGKSQNSTPYKIGTHKQIATKFGTVDYVLEVCPRTNLMTIGSAGASG